MIRTEGSDPANAVRIVGNWGVHTEESFNTAGAWEDRHRLANQRTCPSLTGTGAGDAQRSKGNGGSSPTIDPPVASMRQSSVEPQRDVWKINGVLVAPGNAGMSPIGSSAAPNLLPSTMPVPSARAIETPEGVTCHGKVGSSTNTASPEAHRRRVHPQSAR